MKKIGSIIRRNEPIIKISSINTEAESLENSNTEWWYIEENSYGAGLNGVDGNLYYFLFRRMSGNGRR